MSQPAGWSQVALIAGEGRALASKHLIDLVALTPRVYVRCRCGHMRRQRIVTAHEALLAFGEHLASYPAEETAS